MSVFDEVDPQSWLAHNELAYAIRDAFPVSEGHALVIPRRAVSDWWSATPDEHKAIMQLVAVVKRRLDAEFAPAGYNVGFNAGVVAGQTVDHLHVHVIPRYDGDVDDPRGGIRHVIPGKGNYLSHAQPRPLALRPSLVTATAGEFKLELLRSLIRPDLDRIDLVVSFVMRSGLDLVARHLDDALARGAVIRLLTTDYLGITDTSALGFFLDRASQAGPGQLTARIFSNPPTSFHPKAYLFWSSTTHDGVAYVGSSNLSRSGIASGVEWNIRTHAIGELVNGFETLWDGPHTVALTHEWLTTYAANRPTRQIGLGSPASALEAADEAEFAAAITETETTPQPWSIQSDALAALTATRTDGHRSGLVVMATGLGKTWLGAFDATRPEFRRVLFVAHRQEILSQSRDVFRQIRPDGHLAMFTGDERDATGDVVFATIQSLHRNLDAFDPNEFDYVIIDEFHHASARSYRKVLGYFRPQFTLGLTATPNRADAADLLALCGDNLVYSCGLIDGVRQGLLSPFVYRAIPDVADYENIPWRGGRFDPDELTKELATVTRARQVLDEWRALGGSERRTLGFCCTITHAEFMAEYFRSAGVPAVAVHSGTTSAPRVDSLERLASGDMPVVFTVGLFNEGVDVPAIDVVLLLRPTESPVVFFQQLGRGLRRSAHKTHLDIFDLVGNHRSFLRKAHLLAALIGSRSVSNHDALNALDANNDTGHETELPEGCSIIISPEVIDLLRELAGPMRQADQLASLARQWTEDHDGRRPEALELTVATGKAFTLKSQGGWFGFLSAAGLLTSDEQEVVNLAHEFFEWIEYGSYTKSWKLVTLRVLERNGWLRDGVRVDELAASCQWEVMADPSLRADLNDATSKFVDVRFPLSDEWLRYWQANPINALCHASRGSRAWFIEQDQRLMFTVDIPDRLGNTFDAMTSELVEYRLHRHLQGRNARLGSEVRAIERDGKTIDATFTVEGDLGVPTGIVLESAGGAKGSESARNVDYVAGLDLLFERLRALGATVLDVHIDTARTRDLNLSDRRLTPGELTYPLHLADVVDLVDLRRALLRAMGRTGQTPGVKGGGNTRKRVRIVVALPDEWTVPGLADSLATGDLPSSRSPARNEMDQR